MTVLKFLLLPILAGFLFYGCLPNYYPGIVRAPTPGIISIPPSGSNAPAEAKYFSLDGGRIMPFNNGESNTAFRGRYIEVRSGKHHSVNYGAFAYCGSYIVERVSKYNGEYSYFGPGFEFNGEIHQPVGRVDVGIGMSWSESFEFGNYRTFRKLSDSEGLAENTLSPAVITLSVFPLIRYRVSDRTSVAAQFAVGIFGAISPVIAVQHDDLAIWSCWLPRSLDNPERAGSIFSVGVGHKIP